MRNYVVLVLSEDLLHGALCQLHLVFIDVSRVYTGLTRVLSLRFDQLRRLLLIVFVIAVRASTLVQLVRFNYFLVLFDS